MRRLIVLAALGVALVPLAARPASADVVINNGLGPPNPANVIDAGDSYDEWVFVQNVGCNTIVVDPCPMPWGDPTSVELVEGRMPMDLVRGRCCRPYNLNRSGGKSIPQRE